MQTQLKKYAHTLFILVTFCGCINKDPYPGYKKLTSKVYYKLLTIGNDKRSPVEGDYIKGKIIITDLEGDTTYFQSANATFKLEASKGIDHVFTLFNPFDSLSVIWERSISEKSSLDVLVHFDSIKEVKVNFRMEEIVTAQKFIKDSTIAAVNARENEKDLLTQYLKQHNTFESKKGLYYREIKNSLNGDTLKNGSIVTMEYTARFLDGRLFDATSYWKEPFVFEYGKPDQILEGLEIALSWMKEKDVAKIILPSSLAFGETGSSDGRVPPYTAVMYTVKLINVNNK